MNYEIIQQPELPCCANCRHCDEGYEGDCYCLLGILSKRGAHTSHTNICEGFELNE